MQILTQANAPGNTNGRPTRPQLLRLFNQRGEHTKRRIEITIEKRRLVVINRRRASAVRLCEVCARRVQMVSAHEAAALVGVTPRTIYRWVEEGRLHFTESPEGLLLICVSSFPEPDTSYQSHEI